jgi:hypothetical protein
VTGVPAARGLFEPSDDPTVLAATFFFKFYVFNVFLSVVIDPFNPAPCRAYRAVLDQAKRRIAEVRATVLAVEDRASAVLAEARTRKKN